MSSGRADPIVEPVETLPAHALGQNRDAAAAEDARDRDAAAAVVAGRRPDRPVVLGIEPAGHQPGNQTAIGRQHLVRADHREKAAQCHHNRGAHPGQLGREDEMRPAPRRSQCGGGRCTSGPGRDWPGPADRGRRQEGRRMSRGRASSAKLGSRTPARPSHKAAPSRTPRSTTVVTISGSGADVELTVILAPNRKRRGCSGRICRA